MNKMIPIGLFSALFLTACGGSDGGSSSAPSAKTYNLQFLQMIDEKLDAVDRQCNPANATIFSTKTVNGETINTYGLVAKNGFQVRITDSNDEVVKTFDRNDISSSGTLRLSENQIPDGGYVSVIEQDGSGANIRYALSIQKKLLTNSFIKINNTQGDVACYTGNALKVNAKKKEVFIRAVSDAYSVEDYFDGKTTPSSRQDVGGLTVISPSELVLLSAYRDNGSGTLTDVTHYKYMKSNELPNDISSVSARSGSVQDLSPIEIPLQMSITVDSGSSQSEVFKSLVVNSLYAGYSFNWFSWNEENLNDYYELSAPLGASYAYSAQYNSTINGWNVVSNNVISGGVGTVNLRNINLTTEVPVLSCSTSVNCQLDLTTTGIEDIKGALVEYTYKDGSGFTINHTVYAIGPVVHIPEVIESRYPTDGLTVKASVITSDSNSKNITDIFSVFGRTKGFTPTAGKVEMFLPPALSLKHEELKIKNNYTVFTK